METKTKIQELFGLYTPSTAFGCSAHEVKTLLSKMLAPHGIAILSISYPEVDERNHRSLDTLVHKLIAHGFEKSAENIKAFAPYILFEDLSQCLKVLHEIQQDSAAISVHLYFAGEQGAAAEDAIDKILHPAEKPQLAHAA